MLAGATPKIAAQGLAGRVSTASGDFFKAVPSGGDAYIMKHIIHDWDDEKAALILSNIRAVLPRDGRVILLEAVIPPGNEPGMGKVIDLEMLVIRAAASGPRRSSARCSTRRLHADADRADGVTAQRGGGEAEDVTCGVTSPLRAPRF